MDDFLLDDRSKFYEINKEFVKPCPLCGDPMVLDSPLKLENCIFCEINKISKID